MENKDLDLIRKKVEVYQVHQVVVHVVLKDTGKFYNGKIRRVYNDKFIIMDKNAGKIPILFEEVFRIEPFDKK